MSFQRLFPTFPIPHFGHAVALAKVVAYALTRIKSGLLDGTVSAWQINEGTGTTVGDPVGTNNGTIYGPTWVTNAISGGYALSFDGVDDYYEVPHSESLSFTTAITIELWLNPGTIQNSWTVSKALSAYPFTPANYIVSLRVGGEWEFAFYEAAVDVWHSHETTGLGLTTGTWYHLVATYDGSVVKIYCNGVEKYSAAETTPMEPNTETLRVGWNEGPGYPLHGIVDEVRIYNRALTATEVSDRYNYGLKIRVTNLLEGQKVELYDTADVLKASYTVGVGETEAILDVAALTFPFEGYFKIYDTDGVTLLLKTGIYTDIWGGDVYKFQVV